MAKLTDQEIKELKDRTKQELISTDPQPILDRIGIDYSANGQDSYKLNVRDENTASAYINLKNGIWLYHDFGSGNKGTIENVVMNYTGSNYKDSLELSLDAVGVPNYLVEAFNNTVRNFSKIDEKIKQKQQENKQRSSSVPISKVVDIKDVSTNITAVEYLKSRGINNIPPEFKIITGEYESKKDTKIKKAFGVGVLTQDGKGADIHFLKPFGSMKTMSFGKKELSFFPNKESNKLAIFESKMDYAAAYQQLDLKDTNVVIANTTSNAKKIAALIVENDFNDIEFFNQNDDSGVKFVNNIINESGRSLSDFSYIQYEKGEQKKDINDLLLDHVDLSSRITNGNFNQFNNIAIEKEKTMKKDEITEEQQNEVVSEETMESIMKKADEPIDIKPIDLSDESVEEKTQEIKDKETQKPKEDKKEVEEKPQDKEKTNIQTYVELTKKMSDDLKNKDDFTLKNVLEVNQDVSKVNEYREAVNKEINDENTDAEYSLMLKSTMSKVMPLDNANQKSLEKMNNDFTNHFTVNKVDEAILKETTFKNIKSNDEEEKENKSENEDEKYAVVYQELTLASKALDKAVELLTRLKDTIVEKLGLSDLFEKNEPKKEEDTTSKTFDEALKNIDDFELENINLDDSDKKVKKESQHQ